MGIKKPRIWTPDRDDIFFAAVAAGKTNREIADLCGVTKKQVDNKRKNELAYGTDSPEEGEWTQEMLVSWNSKALHLLREHCPEELERARKDNAIHSRMNGPPRRYSSL